MFKRLLMLSVISIITLPAYASEVDLEFFQKDRAGVALAKREAWTEKRDSLQAEIKSDTAKLENLREKNLEDDEQRELERKILLNSLNEEISLKKVEKYQNLFDFYSSFSDIGYFLSLSEEIEYYSWPNGNNWSYTKDPLYRHCFKPSVHNQRPFAQPCLSSQANVIRKQSTLYEEMYFKTGGTSAYDKETGEPFFDTLYPRFIGEVSKVVGFDVSESNNDVKLEKLDKRLESFQRLFLDRHTNLEHKAKNLALKKINSDSKNLEEVEIVHQKLQKVEQERKELSPLMSFFNDFYSDLKTMCKVS